MSEELKTEPQDIVQAVQMQRDTALNEVVHLRALLAAAGRRIDELSKDVIKEAMKNVTEEG